MYAKCLFINPHPSPGPQSLIISGDREALTECRDKLTELLETGKMSATAKFIEIESRKEITYRFIAFPENLMRMMDNE